MEISQLSIQTSENLVTFLWRSPCIYLLLNQCLNLLRTNIGHSTVTGQQKSLSEPHYVTARQRVTNKALAKREADASLRSARSYKVNHSTGV